MAKSVMVVAYCVGLALVLELKIVCKNEGPSDERREQKARGDIEEPSLAVVAGKAGAECTNLNEV